MGMSSKAGQINWPLIVLSVQDRSAEMYFSEKDFSSTVEWVNVDDEDPLIFDAEGTRLRVQCRPWDGITQIALDTTSPTLSLFTREHGHHFAVFKDPKL